MEWQLAVVVICILWAATQLLGGVRRWLRQERGGCGGCGAGAGCESPAPAATRLVSLQEPAKNAAPDRDGRDGDDD